MRAFRLASQPQLSMRPRLRWTPPPAPALGATVTLSREFSFLVLNQLNSPESLSSKNATSRPSSSSVLVSCPTAGLPELLGTSAEVPPTPGITLYWLVPANVSG